MPPHTPGDAPRGASPAEGALSGPQRLLDYVTQAGNEATVKGAAREMGVHPRSIRRYRERLAEAGHDVSALGTDPSRQYPHPLTVGTRRSVRVPPICTLLRVSVI